MWSNKVNINSLLFSGSSHRQFSENVADHLNIKLSSCEIGKFSNGEIKININGRILCL